MDYTDSWESHGASLELASSSCVSEVGFGYVPPASKHLAFEPITFEHSASEGVTYFDPPASRESFDMWNYKKNSIVSEILLSGSLSLNLICIDSSTIMV